MRICTRYLIFRIGAKSILILFDAQRCSRCVVTCLKKASHYFPYIQNNIGEYINCYYY